MALHEALVKVAKDTKLPTQKIREVFRAIGVELVDTVASEGRFMWPGVGNFYVRELAPRTVRPPGSGTQKTMPARCRLGLRASKTTEEVLNDSDMKAERTKRSAKRRKS